MGRRMAATSWGVLRALLGDCVGEGDGKRGVVVMGVGAVPNRSGWPAGAVEVIPDVRVEEEGVSMVFEEIVVINAAAVAAAPLGLLSVEDCDLPGAQTGP